MILMELGLGLVVIAWAAWQLVDLKRERKKDEAKRAAARADDA